MCLKSKTGFGQTWSNDKLNYLKWKTFEYQVDRDHQDPNILYRPFFHLGKFKYTILTKSWISHKLYETICENCGFTTAPSQQFVNCKNGLYIKCRSWWVEQFSIHYFSSRDHLRFRKPVHGYEFFQNSKLSASNSVKWPIWSLQMKQFEYKVVIDHQDIHLIHCPFFHLGKFLANPRHMSLKSKIGFWSNLVKWQTKLLKMKNIWIPSW